MKRYKKPVAIRGVFLLLIVLLGSLLASCGNSSSSNSAGTTQLTASISLASGSVLGENQALTITFDKSMNTASLALGGALAGESDGGVWSSTSHTNDTLTITPISSWANGTDRDISVDAKDLAGDALPTLSARYQVRPVFNNFQAAAVVIGQPNFTSRGDNRDNGIAGANTLGYPHGNPLVTPDGMLFISDNDNNRVLGFNSVPSANNANADFVLGQTDFTTTTSNLTQAGMDGPMGVSMAGNKLLVDDFTNGRVLVYNSIPTSGPTLPDVVMGNADFTQIDAGCDASQIYIAESVTGTPDGKVIVTDTSNNRVLIWNSVPTHNFQPADLVLGQADFNHCTENDDNQDGHADGIPSERTLAYPTGVWSDGTHLVVADSSNNRVLIWNSFPTRNFQPADVVLGQSDFKHDTANDDNQDGIVDSIPSNRTLQYPENGVTSNGTQLAVSDINNNRVLIWNSFPSRNFQPADVVLGQGDFTHNTCDDDNQDRNFDGNFATARVLCYPTGVFFYQDKLFVADESNSRVLIFKSQ